MDVKIRNIDPMLVKKIDEMARKQKVSRQVFLKNVLENFATVEKFKELEGNYLDIVDRLAFIIKDNTLTMKSIKELLEV